MPKQKITREMVVDAAFDIARHEGMEQVLVKTIADRLGCSVQPIYSYCSSMKELRQAVTEQADLFMHRYIQQHIDPADMFRSTGVAYLNFAAEEPHLFQLFIQHRRDGIANLDEFYRRETNPQVAQSIAEALHVSVAKARRLHLNMLIFTTGIGTILATTAPDLPMDELLPLLESAHQAFLKQTIE